MMDPKQLMKQMMDFNKAAFNNSFSALVAIQEQSEKMFSLFLEQAPWLPDEGKKTVRDWSKNFKKSRDDFKSSVDEGYKKMESYVSEMDKGKSK